MHSKQWHYSLHRDFQNCYSTRRSPTGFFSSNSSSNSTRVPIQHTSSIHHPHLHVHIQRILHPEIQFYMQKTKSSSSTTTTLLHYRGLRDLHSRFQKRNSTHRRQGDLLEMHPCVLQDIPGIPATSLSRHSRHSSLSSLSRHSSRSRDIPDIPVIHDLPAFPGNSTNSTSSSISRESTPFQHSPTRMHILQFLQFDWFPQKLHRVPVEQLQTLHYRHYILQRKGDVVISVKRASVKMSR